uniref:Uncharacterized protein n=1 Tax=Glossina brevipalpis TaxID=37001 RepID=A0A1A9X1Y5_9MUSC
MLGLLERIRLTEGNGGGISYTEEEFSFMEIIIIPNTFINIRFYIYVCICIHITFVATATAIANAAVAAAATAAGAFGCRGDGRHKDSLFNQTYHEQPIVLVDLLKRPALDKARNEKHDELEWSLEKNDINE